MPFLTLGTPSQLQIKVPTAGTTDWADVIKTDNFQKIVEHDHSGGGKGSQLGPGSLLDNAVDGVKFRLSNDQYLRARDNANSADVNILKINTSDKLEFATEIAILDLVHDTYLRARNAADNGFVNIAKVNANDKVEFGSTIESATYDTLTGVQTNAAGSTTLADNTSSPIDAGVITLSPGETATIKGKLDRAGVVRKFTLELDQDNNYIIESFSGQDVGVDFSFAANQLQYTSTNTGNNITMTYTIIKE